MVSPNLFLVGAAKSGTTSLHYFLHQHPDIFMSEPKEPGFFVPGLAYYPKEPSWYFGLFDGAGDARWIGESSTHYSKRPLYEGVAERIREFNPHSRIIYLMRDPVDRAISQYWHNLRHHEERRPPIEAIRDGVSYKAFGSYAMQLKPWIQEFGRAQVLPLVFEEMVADSEAIVRHVLEWLDVAPLASPLEVEARNVKPQSMTRVRGRGVLNWIRRSRLWDLAAPSVPRGLRNWAATRAVAPVREQEFDIQPVVEELRPWAREEIAKLESLLGRRFPLWKTSLTAPSRDSDQISE